MAVVMVMDGGSGGYKILRGGGILICLKNPPKSAIICM